MTETANPARPKLDANTSADLHRHDVWQLRRLVAFVLLYLVAASGAVWLALADEAAALGPWWILAALQLYLLAAASLHGISLFTHEGVHGALSRNPTVNRWLSIACAMPVLQNYSAYKVLHLRHHRHLGHEGDPDHYKNYTSWSWLVFAMHWGRLIIGYPAYLVMIPILGYRQGLFLDRAWIVLELVILVALVALVIASPISWGVLLHAWLIPMIFINTMINIRGMSQHTLLEHETDAVRGTRTILANRVVAFFMCNENYHLEHHLYPGVPWYNLPKVHDALERDLRSNGAPLIGSYFEFVRDFVIASIRRSPIGTVQGRVRAESREVKS